MLKKGGKKVPPLLFHFSITQTADTDTYGHYIIRVCIYFFFFNFSYFYARGSNLMGVISYSFLYYLEKRTVEILVYIFNEINNTLFFVIF